MLPEHIKLLREWQADDTYIVKPELNESDLEEMQEQLNSALLRGCLTLIKIWDDGEIKNYTGTVERIDTHNQLVVLQDPFELERIPANKIISVQHMD